ncbi:MAG: hypothetical protein AAFY71_03875 [Bacteroidota bacterium]
MSSSTQYSFERNNFNHRDEKKALEAYTTFLLRINLPDDKAEGIKPLLIDFIKDIHLRIKWYSRKLSVERAWGYVYIGMTILLLGAIPLLVFYLSDSLAEMKAESAYVMVAALISGILGTHKGFSSWLEQRRVVGTFWEALADLKELLYELEDKHRKLSAAEWNEDSVEDLLDDMRKGSSEALKIERKERDAFFKNYKIPKFDLVNTLLNSGRRGQDITDLYLSEQAQEQLAADEIAAELSEDLFEAQTEMRQYEIEVADLRILVDVRAKELEDASEDEKSALKAGLKELQVKLERAEAKLISAGAKVRALRAALGLEDE